MMKLPKRKIIVATSYEIVTEKSVKEGAVAEQGWIDKEGTEFDTIQEVVNFLEGEGVIEASSPCGLNAWYENQQKLNEYNELETHHFHIKNASLIQQVQIYMKIFPQEEKKCAARLKELRKAKRKEILGRK